MSPITLDPITRNAVPCNAVSIRNIKKVAKFGDSAVAIEKMKNSTELNLNGCAPSQSIFEPHAARGHIASWKTESVY